MRRRRFSFSPEKQKLLARLLEGQGTPAAAARPAVTRRVRDGELPLSFAQQRLWFLARLEPESPAYNIPVARRLSGRLDSGALLAALGEIVRRHESLRTRFPERDGRPRQEVVPAGVPILPLVDLTSLPRGGRFEEARRRLAAEGRRPFRVTEELPLRSHLWRLGSEEHVFFVNTHHIASDGWSQGIFNRELTVLYEAFSRRAPSPLPEPRVQYADFAAWQREWLRGELLENQLAYWRRQLEGLRALELPTDRPRPAVRTDRGASLSFVMPEELAVALRKLSVAAGASLFMTLLAAFVALLYRLTGKRDVAVGTAIANRRYEEIEDLIGFFINTLVLRSRPEPRQSFSALLAQVRETCLEAYRHQDLPFERLVEELDPDRHLSRSPLFQVMLVLQNAPFESPSMSGVAVAAVPLGVSRPHFDLNVSLHDDGKLLRAHLSYRLDLFDATSMRRLARSFQALAGSLAEDPRRGLGGLAVLGTAERHQLLWEWSGTPASSEEGCLGELFEAQADRTPDAVAVVRGDERWSYRRLAGRARELAGRLRRLGVGAETVVAVHLGQDPETIAAVLAVLLAGGAYLPLDSRTPPERRERMLRESRAAALLTSGEVVSLRKAPAAPGRAGAGNAAYVLYTSGSSGRPKGVVVEHRQVLSYVRAVCERLALGPRASFVLVQPLSVDSSKTTLFPPLLLGGCLHLVDERDATDPGALGRLFRRERIDVLKIAPSHLAALAEGVEALDLLPVRALVIGGEAWPGDWRKRWGAALGRCRVYNHYGPTEVTVGTHAHRVTAPGATVGLGRPLGNSEAYLVDASLRPAALGVPGELLLGGAGLARGYLGRPGRTAECFLPHPFTAEPGARVYRSGDLARLRADGRLELLGRRDEQVKIRGFRVEPGEVEAALGEHPGVAASVVAVRGEPARLVAYLRPASPPAPDLAELRRFLRSRLPEHMWPEALVVVAELPRTPHGKIDRGRLPEATPSESGGTASEGPARSPSEEILTEIWEALLGTRGIGIHDDFFQLGGHSLVATRVVSRVRRAFGVELPVRSVFEKPTVAELAAEIDSRRARRPGTAPPPPVSRRRGAGEKPPLSFAQQRLWFLQQLAPSSSVYNMPGARRLSGRLDVAALQGALGEIVRRHETLRTLYPAKDGRPRQEVAAAGTWVLPLVDLRGLPPPVRVEETRRRLATEARRPFRLAAEPPLRSHLFRLDGEEHVLFVNTHHIASDGWSQGIFNRELTVLCEAFALREPSPLPELGVQYADFAAWQREQLRGEALEAQVAYWRRQLDGLQVLELPPDRPRPAVQTESGGAASFVLPEDLSLSLRHLAAQAGASLYMTLLAAFVTLLHRLTGQGDLAVGSPIANRRHEEIEGVIGFFVNTLVLRSRPQPRRSFAELLARVREICLDAYLHQDLPFEKLVEELEPDRDLSRTPLFQVMLVLQNAPPQRVSMSQVDVSAFPLGAARAHFDLTATFYDGGKRIWGHWSYNADLFDATTLERVSRRFKTLFEGVVEDPERSLMSLDLLGAAERHQVLREWNDTAWPPSSATVVGAFERQAAATPESAALVWEDVVLSYRELDERSRRVAGRLRRLGASPGGRVGVALERSPEMAVAVLGILKAGAAYVPLDPSYPPYRLRFMLAEAELVLTQESLRGALAELAGESLRFVDFEEGEDEMATDAFPEPHPENLAYVIYTSGSTGIPKGIALSHRALSNLIEWHLDVLVRRARTLQYASLSFDASFHEMFATWCSGGTLHVVSEELRRDVPALSRYLAARRVEKVILPVVVLHRLAEEVLEHGIDLADLGELTTTGEQLHVTPRVAEVFERFPDVGFHNHYGPSETHVVTASTLSGRPSSWRSHPSIGRPIRRTQIRILDPWLFGVGIGQVGELFVGGVSLARGYVGRPALSAEKLLPDPFAAEGGARLYRTGDQARWLADGTIEFLGRLDHQVKIRGFRVEVEEIEAVLTQHPAVSEAAVVAWGDGAGSAERWLAGFVVGPAAGLRAYLEERLPAYMVPRALVSVAALPLSPTGKVDRGELRRRAAAERPKAAPNQAAARTPSEEMLAEVWEELLGLRGVGVHDDFFQLGGHSLLATQVVSRIRRLFGVEVPVRSVFERPTVAALAAEVNSRRRQGIPAWRPLSPRLAGSGELPLSFAQQRLWFLQELQPSSSVYNMPGARRLLGRLDAGALRRALGEVVRRHEALRTRFPATDGRPRQEVADAGSFTLALVDLLALPKERRAGETRYRLSAEGRRPFRLATELPLRAHLFRLDAEEHVLFVNTHHICSDGWSLGIMNRELTAIYDAFARGEPSPLPEPGVQYADFAVWQREQLQGEVLESHLAYWRRQLDGLQGLELPADRPRPEVGAATGASLPLALSEEVSRSLRRRGAEAGASLYMTLLAAFVALLHRVTGQGDVAVGSPIANRRYEEVEGLIGFFVNTLVLRSRPGPRQAFGELLRQVRETCLDAYLHQDLPFERLVEELDPERDLTHSPLFQVMLALQNAPREDVRMAEVEIRPFPLAASRAHFELNVSFQEAEGRLVAHLSYDAGLFDRTTMQRLARRFGSLLESAAADPGRSLESLAPLPPGERHQLLVEHNDTASAGSWRLLIERFEHHARRRPGEVAVVFAGEPMTYGELERGANRWAHHLRDRGVAPESVVGLCVEPSIERVVAMLAILKAGGACLPLDPGYPRARLAFMIADAGVRLLVTERHLLDALPAEGVETLCLDDERELVAHCGEEPPVSGVTPENVAYVIYTSGSTGRPKAIVVRHRGASNNLEDLNASFGVGLGDRVLALSSVSFDMSVYEVFGLLGAGGTVVIPEASEARDPAAWASLLDRHGVTVWNTAPALLEMLVARLEEGRDARPRLKVAILGGDWVPVTLPDRLKALSAGVRVIVLGGATEASIHSIVFPVEATDRRWRSIPYGRPMRNQEAFLFDAQMRAVPLGVAGELYLGGMGLARGYLGRPGLTAERFVPWALGGRLYKTGDLARRLFDGTIELLGRIDHQVKVRGFRVELGEVGNALQGHPGIEDAVVVAGVGGLAAYYVPRQGALSACELRDYLLGRLPEYMVPSSYSPLAALPLSPNGKVDRRSLPEPEPEAVGGEVGFVEPRTPVETVVAEIWAEVLGRERVGVLDSFFALGGHSLLVTRVVSRVRRFFDVELPVRGVFEKPTVAALAQEIEDRRRTRGPGGRGAAPLHARPPGIGELPLSFAQQRLWFLQELTPGSSAYNLPNARRFRGRLDTEVLRRALQEVVRRHQALRTRFPATGGRPRQEVVDVGSFTLPHVDLAFLPPERRPAEARRRLTAEGRRPFRLAVELPIRSHLWRLAPEEHVLFVNTHHIASDGWSQGIFNRELARLYEAFLGGAPSPLVDLAVQYADFALWQREWLQGEELKDQLGYWRQRLHDLRVPELPADRPRPATRGDQGASLPVALPGTLVRGLRQLGSEAGASLFMTLLAAFAALLHRLTGQGDAVVGSPIANRQRVEVEGLIGFFVNTLVLRCRPAAAPSFRDLLAQVREICLEAYRHQDLPFEKLVEELDPDRDLARSPLFQVMLVLQNAPGRPLALPGIEVTPFALGTRGGRFDLALSLFESGDEILGSADYGAGLFNATTIARLVRSLQAVLADAVADPSRPPGQLSILSAGERHQLLLAWNDTGLPVTEPSFLSAIEAQVRRTPDAVAVSDATTRLTYAELAAAADRVGRHLLAAGLDTEDVVALFAERNAAFLATLLGILKAGGVYLPLDPGQPDERLARMVRQSAPKLILHGGNLESKLVAGFGARTTSLMLEDLLTRPAPAARPRPPVSPEQLAYVLFTSGSTGRPKAVMVTHRGIGNHLALKIRDLGLRGSDVLAQTASQSFDTSVGQFLPTLLVGGRLHVVPPETALDPRSLLEEIDRAGVSVLEAVPSYLEILAGELERRRPPLPRLRWVLSLGEPLQGPLARRWRRACPGARLVNAYGPAECSVGVTHLVVAEKTSSGARVPIGRASSNLRFHVTDGSLRLIPQGVIGELCIGGAGVGRGYRGAAQETARSFVPDPFGGPPGGRLYRSGDRARWLGDGTVELVGRVDHQVKIRGVRLELGEVEAALRAPAEVTEAAVVATGEGAGRRLVAFVVPRDASGGLEARLREHLSDRLPDVMRPAVFRELASLPRLPSGKVDRRTLERQAADVEGATDGGGLAGPRSPEEKALAEIFSELLQRQDVGRHDDFFRLGGHSLLAAVLVARIESRCGVRLPLAVLFRHPTVAGLAAVVSRGAVAGGSPLVSLRDGGPETPFFCVHPAGGGILCYTELARRIGTDRSFFALKARGYEDGEPPHDEIPAMAADYLAEARERNGEPPRWLGGWSFGGVVAYEMARQLHEAGHEAPCLVLLDSSAPVPGPPDRDPAELLGGFARHLGLDDLPGLDGPRALDRIYQEVLGTGLWTSEVGVERIDRLFGLYRAHVEAWAKYSPQPYGGRLALFRARDRAPSETRAAGWDRLAVEVEVRFVPGNHFSMMHRPHVDTLAGELRRYMEKCGSR